MNHRAFMVKGIAAVAFASLAPLSLAAGPDIIHSDLQDTTHYGPVAGIHAYAWGTNTCNIGDTALSWISHGTPALGMNAYRLYDGQLLHIGLGGCKTGCCVSNGPGCTGLTCSSTGTGLRPGCRDVYSAGFNGGQAALGPRSIINPFEGSFQAIPAGSGDAVWRRCQVAQADMSPTTFPGALYFAEGEYVCTEENPAEELNNCTYRRCTVANTGATPTYAWSVADTSQVGRPAIYAWRDHGLGLGQPDTSVSIVNADIPGEGRFVVAGKVRDLGGGQWRYDYAVFNLNSHVSGASFSVGVPGAASMNNPGFNAPRYHSGEIYDNTVWAQTRSGDTATWSSPQTFDQNQNTNALRWGTMYNFWFTSNAAPSAATGSVSIGLFRPYTFNGNPVTSVVASGLPVPAVVCVNTGVANQPVPVSVCPGGTASLSVTASPDGTGPLNYRWRRADATAPGGFLTLSDGPTPWGGGSSITGATTSMIVIHNVSSKDAGANAYSVTISNGCSAVSSSPAAVTLCRADYNCTGAVSVQDIFDFVGDYFANDLKADINGDAAVSVEDVFGFLGLYFTGC